MDKRRSYCCVTIVSQRQDGFPRSADAVTEAFLFDFSADTCHFQKLQEESKSNEFDFHWNTSPTSIVCAFPYIIAFTPDSIEIRLLVNGNLVHTATMADLQMITSKRDIFFATTAPEFIPKDFRIGCLENEQIQECDSRRPSRANEFSNERILEIRHKIDKIDAQTKCDIPDEPTGPLNGQNKSLPRPQIVTQPDSLEQPMHINAEDSFSKFLHLPRPENSPCIQRARSLQKPRDRNVADDQKRLISKSNSCGDSCPGAYPGNKEFPAVVNSVKEPLVPPNSPKTNSTNLLNSPTKSRLLKSPNNNKFIQNYLTSANGGESSGPDKCKPLRIFRIPLFNLTGTHSHYHTHSSTPKTVAKKPPRKIEEDDALEMNESVFDDDTSNGIQTNEINVLDDNCDTIDLRNNLQKLSTSSLNMSLFSSI